MGSNAHMSTPLVDTDRSIPSLPAGYSPDLTQALRRAARVQCGPVPQRKLPDSGPPLTWATPLFANAREAVRFAVTREGAPARPYMSRFNDKVDLLRRSLDLSGLDQAAQAGLILSALRFQIGALSLASITAACAPPIVPCTCGSGCCSGGKTANSWHEAVTVLADASCMAVPGRAPVRLRRACLVRIYGGKRGTLLDISAEEKFDTKTVAKYHGQLFRWLKGATAKAGDAPIEGLESCAWRDAESVLQDLNIVSQPGAV